MALNTDRDRALSYHPLTPGRDDKHERLREAAKVYAAVLEEVAPRSREESLAFTAIQDSLMWGNAAIAIHDDASGG